MLSWIPEPQVAGGQELTYGRSLQRHLAHFNLPAAFTEWAPLAQDRAGWRKLVTEPPFKLIGKPFVRQPRGDTRVSRSLELPVAKKRHTADHFNATWPTLTSRRPSPNGHPWRRTALGGANS